MKRTVRVVQWLAFGMAPVALTAFSTGPPVRVTGVPADGVDTCFRCHRDGPPVNQAGGRVTVNASGYTPGQKQTITIRIEDPTALRWGFELTARLAADETKPAGEFTSTDAVRVVCATGANFPDRGKETGCGGQVQFATHRQAATRAGSGGPQSFVIEWTPPGRDVGEVIFYVAANAANNSNTNAGDHIYTANQKVSSTGCNLTGTPTILDRGVGNAGSFATGLAPNSIISVFGTGLAPTDLKYSAARGDLVNGAVATDLACVGLEIGGKKAPVFFVSAGQINAQAPWIDPGPQTVRVVLNPGTPNEIKSAPITVNAGRALPGFFTFNGKTIAGLNASEDNKLLVDPALVAGGVFAEPGHIVVLYGTGFGFTDPVYQPGEFMFPSEPARLPAGSYTITMGGTTLAAADILYAGLSADAPGFYQFNLRVPASAPAGDLPVTITVGGVSTQSGATIPVKR